MRYLKTIKSVKQGTKWNNVTVEQKNITDEEYSTLVSGWKWDRIYKNYHRNGYEPEKLITYSPDRSEKCTYIVTD